MSNNHLGNASLGQMIIPGNDPGNQKGVQMQLHLSTLMKPSTSRPQVHFSVWSIISHHFYNRENISILQSNFSIRMDFL